MEAPTIVGSPLEGDLVPPAAPANEEVVQAPGDPGTSGTPRVFYLNYADGHSSSHASPNPCQKTPPKFVCEFAPTAEECQRQIQAYLDDWYADFNIVFTLTRPTSGAYYTEIVSSGGGDWCDAATNVAGIAPFLCDDLQGGVAYTFLGGKSAKETAIIIAQEQAHLVGLEHTLSTKDIMDPTICPNCDGFENVSNKIQNDHCNRAKQNSYEMMRQRLGAWSGGVKPTPFGCQPDKDPPTLQILSPADNSSVAGTFVLRVQASDACKISQVKVAVAPMGLHAQSNAGPFEWTLAKISGRQTITVTAFDASGKQTSTSITVNAGSAAKMDAGTKDAADGGGPAAVDTDDAGGCACDAGAGGETTRSTSLLASLVAMALILSARTRAAAATRSHPRRFKNR